MEVTLLGHKYSVREKWIARWELLSNYREDTGSNVLPIPSTSSITKSEMDKWVELNDKMDKWIFARYVITSEKLQLNTINRVVQYFLPASGFYLMFCDFSSFGQLDRIRFLRELGRWTRDEPIRQVYRELVSSDTFRRLKACVTSIDPAVDREVFGELIELAEKIPIDFLYGLMAVSEGDWVYTPWRDAYDGCLLLAEEWESACVNLITYYINNRDKLVGKCYNTTIQSLCLRPVSMTPSNMIRLFNNKELISIRQGRNYPVPISLKGDILSNVKRYAEETISPDLFRYGLDPRYSSDEEQTAPVVSVYEDELSPRMSEFLHDIDTDMIGIQAYIPDLPAYLNRIWDYMEKHASWKTWDILFDEVGRLDVDDVLVREASLLPVFDVMALLHLEGLVAIRDTEGLIFNIAATLGTRALRAISACLLGAVEKEPLSEYVKTTPLYNGEEFDIEAVEERQENLMAFCENIITYLEGENRMTDFITWPTLIIQED